MAEAEPTQIPGYKNVRLYDHLGRPMKEKPPRVMSGTWCRKVYYKGPTHGGPSVGDADYVREELVRAQVPYIVTLLVYHSKLQVDPTMREYFVYAPMAVQKAAELALRLWQRWERPPRPEILLGDMRDVFPKVEDGIVAEPIGDEDFDAHWRDVRVKPHRAAGNPGDPFAFTCLDQDVRIYKTADFQSGLHVKIK